MELLTILWLQRPVIITFCIISFLLPAKGQEYSFSLLTNNNYQNLDSTLSLNLTNNIIWEDEQFIIPIGFSFPIQGNSYDSVKVEDDGILIFFQKCGLDTADTNVEGPQLLALFCDLADRGVFLGDGDIPISPISYLVEGNIDEKILKIEWKNATLSFGEGYDDYINFQVWLYENGTIEIRLGTSNVTDPSDPDVWGWGEPGPLVNFMYEIDCSLIDTPVSLHIFGNAVSPNDTIIQGSIQVLPVVPINNVPPAGTVYQFSPTQQVSDRNTTIQNFGTYNLYPNPILTHATIEYSLLGDSEISIQLLNVLGKTLKIFIENQKQEAGKHRQTIIFPENFPAGSYIIQIVSPIGAVNIKAIK